MKTIVKPGIFLRLILLFLVLPVFAFAQINVFPLGKDAPAKVKNGLIYALPRNVIKVELTVQKSESLKGPYSDFAVKYLGLMDFIEKNTTVYSIADVKIEVLSETDPEQYYYIELDEKSKQGRSLLFAMNSEGFISGYSDLNKTSAKNREGKQHSPFVELFQPAVIEKVDTIIRKISVDTSTYSEVFVRRSVSERTVEQQARETADQIRRLSDNKYNLITGYQEVNYSKEALEYMVTQIEKTRQEYLNLFKGVTTVSETRHVFFVTPGNEPGGTLETICGFSASAGVMPRNTPGSEAVHLVLEPLNGNSVVRDFIASKDKPSKEKRGLYYRIPEKSRITVRAGNRNLISKEAMISQAGSVAYLPAGVFSYVKLNPATGAIEMISTE